MPYTLYVGLPAGQLPNQTNRTTSSPIWLWSYRGIQAMEVGAWGWRYTYLCISCHPLHVHLTSPYRRSFYLSSISVCVFQFVELVSISFDTNNSTAFLPREGFVEVYFMTCQFSVSVSIFFFLLSVESQTARLTFNGGTQHTLKSATIKLIQNASNGYRKHSASRC